MLVRGVLVVVAVLFGLVTWQVGTMLVRSDLLWGIGLGALVGIPMGLYVLAAMRREEVAPVAVAPQPHQPQPEDDALFALWPQSFTAMGLDGKTEEWIEEVER